MKSLKTNKSRNFKYFQPNEKDIRDNYGDCVVRALCKAFDKSWLETYDLLVKKGTKRPLVKQFAYQHKQKTVMVVANHLVACEDGYFYDMWDCGNKSMYGYWTKGE